MRKSLKKKLSLNRETLRALFPHYLFEAAPHLEPDDARFSNGVDWACRPLVSAIALLSKVGPGHEQVAYQVRVRAEVHLSGRDDVLGHGHMAGRHGSLGIDRKRPLGDIFFQFEQQPLRLSFVILTRLGTSAIPPGRRFQKSGKILGPLTAAPPTRPSETARANASPSAKRCTAEAVRAIFSALTARADRVCGS